MPTESQDAAVRHYLQALKDPDSLRDDEAISQLQRRLEHTEDPLERLELRAELERAQQVDPGAYEYGSIAHAKRWARAHGVSSASFKAEGVSDDVLARAGLIEGRRSQRSPATSRRRRVSRDQVRQAMRRYQAFTMRQIQNDTGASRETVRAVLNELLDAGEIQAAGTDQAHTGRGRASTMYQHT